MITPKYKPVLSNGLGVESVAIILLGALFAHTSFRVC
jgi:hypothetical protein